MQYICLVVAFVILANIESFSLSKVQPMSSLSRFTRTNRDSSNWSKLSGSEFALHEKKITRSSDEQSNYFESEVLLLFRKSTSNITHARLSTV